MKKSTPFLMPLFRSALFIAVGLLFAVLTKQSLQQASRWWTVLCVLCNIITILVLMAICKRDGITYKQLIGYEKKQSKIKYILFIIVIMLLTGIGGMYGAGFMIYGHIPVIMVQPVPIWIAAVNVILLPLTIVFAELPLYFGYSINGIEKATGNKILAIVNAMFFLRFAT
ncbi:MAG: hypothetical protein GYA50_01590 [Eubacteriaceae bacterium]|nr:hypothetical protein [Eubacteriaceae bacterium]